jgi:hypothetical protein
VPWKDVPWAFIIFNRSHPTFELQKPLECLNSACCFLSSLKQVLRHIYTDLYSMQFLVKITYIAMHNLIDWYVTSEVFYCYEINCKWFCRLQVAKGPLL